jgi:hypothetical protein
MAIACSRRDDARTGARGAKEARGAAAGRLAAVAIRPEQWRLIRLMVLVEKRKALISEKRSERLFLRDMPVGRVVAC